MKRPGLADLYTQEGKNLNGTPWDVYPRPQMKRDSYLTLNGTWQIRIGEAQKRPILVPFSPESLLSGVHETVPSGTMMTYERTFTLPDGFVRDRVLLHFGAVDQEATVYLNGQKIGTHVGGYEAFSFDITDALQAENHLIVEAVDRLTDEVLPYGKQCEKRGGMWYTPVSGIWQSVWLESVPENAISHLKIFPHEKGASITVTPAVSGEILLHDGKEKRVFALTDGQAHIVLDEPVLWSPENPHLYYFDVISGQDKVTSYFAVRTLSVREINGIPRICLNGEPYFFHGLLDQGYYSDGIYTPASPTLYEGDILTMKRMGFNTLRKHIKVEPEQFYYDCDRLGMIVFQDMVNNSDYGFIRDTVIPTFLTKKRKDRHLHKDPASREAFRAGAVSTVEQLYNHPSICYWTIFNEGWGQFLSDEQYHFFRTLDTSRIIDTTSGWFLAGGESDVDSQHVYFKPVKIKAGKKPVIVSEFGGYSYAVEGHVFNLESSYGYGKYKDRKAWEDAVIGLYENEILPAIKCGLCGSVYTQVSDVEDEINGFLTYDRAVCKGEPARFKEMAESLYEAYRNL